MSDTKELRELVDGFAEIADLALQRETLLQNELEKQKEKIANLEIKLREWEEWATGLEAMVGTASTEDALRTLILHYLANRPGGKDDE